MSHYLFGYGSLINTASRAKTGETQDAFPATLTGYQREWNIISSSNGICALGLLEQPGQMCNGVLAKIDESEIPAFDQRESVGPEGKYIRKEITIDLINTPLALRGSDKVWAYLTRAPQTPSNERPICQSYVDVVLMGCLSYGEEFAIKFLETTIGWHGTWINDRSAPRYTRSLEDESWGLAETFLTTHFQVLLNGRL